MLKKYMNGAAGAWEKWLPTVQLAMNSKINLHTKTSPFTLMFGRTFNDFLDYSTTMTIEDIEHAIQSRISEWKMLREVILPGVRDASREVKQKMRKQLDTKRKQQEPLAPGTSVMAIDPTRGSKWEPTYEGPFVVVKQHKGQAYSLRDQTGEILPSRKTIDMLVPINRPFGKGEVGAKQEEGKGEEFKERAREEDDMEDKDQHYQVKAIINHKMNKHKGGYAYLVQWQGYKEADNSWVDEEDFDDIAIVRKYWKERAKEKRSEKMKRGGGKE
jgi:hypothetical protein